MIGSERVAGKPHIRFAVSYFSGQAVVLKFYHSRELFQKSLAHSMQLSAQYVCKYMFPSLERLSCAASKGRWIGSMMKGSVFHPAWCLKEEITVWTNGLRTCQQSFLKGRLCFSRFVFMLLISVRLFLHQVLQCLHYIHSQDIVHGDIKPSNIMFFP